MPRRLLEILVSVSLASAGCRDPLAPGNTLRLDAVVRTYHDCSVPPPPGPQDSLETPPPVGIVPPFDCGARRDTVEGGRREIHGDLRASTRRAGSVPSTGMSYVAEGVIEETYCDPDCRVVFHGVRRAEISRTRVYCASADLRRNGSTGGVCADRAGETIVVVTLQLEGRATLGEAFVAIDDWFRSGVADSYLAPVGWPRSWRHVEWSLD